VRYKIWSFWNHGAGKESDTEEITLLSVFVRKTTMEKKEACVSARHFTWLLSCPLSCPFFSKLYRQSRLTLVPSFFLERVGVEVSICGNDARKVIADWLIAKSRTNFWKKSL